MDEYINSSRYFENRECKYYPCHSGLDHINCMFCYCPFYAWEKCPGVNEYKVSKSGNRVKVCTNCIFAHDANSYDRVMEILQMGEDKYLQYSNGLSQDETVINSVEREVHDSTDLVQDKGKLGILYGIGVGPGEAELITKKAINIIDKVDVLILPAKDKDSCRAYTIAAGIIPNIDNKCCECMPFPMSMKEPELSQFHRSVADRIETLLGEGKNVGFLTIGDVSIYSTFDYIDKLVTIDGYKTKYISGIPSFVATAAKLGVPLAIGSEQIHVIPGSADIIEAMKLEGTIIFMKSGKGLAELKNVLMDYEAAGDISVAAVSNCGMENEMVATSANDIKAESGYLTVVIVKKNS